MRRCARIAPNFSELRSAPQLGDARQLVCGSTHRVEVQRLGREHHVVADLEELVVGGRIGHLELADVRQRSRGGSGGVGRLSCRLVVATTVVVIVVLGR